MSPRRRLAVTTVPVAILLSASVVGCRGSGNAVRGNAAGGAIGVGSGTGGVGGGATADGGDGGGGVVGGSMEPPRALERRLGHVTHLD